MEYNIYYNMCNTNGNNSNTFIKKCYQIYHTSHILCYAIQEMSDKTGK